MPWIYALKLYLEPGKGEKMEEKISMQSFYKRRYVMMVIPCQMFIPLLIMLG